MKMLDGLANLMFGEQSGLSDTEVYVAPLPEPKSTTGAEQFNAAHAEALAQQQERLRLRDLRHTVVSYNAGPRILTNEFLTDLAAANQQRRLHVASPVSAKPFVVVTLRSLRS